MNDVAGLELDRIEKTPALSRKVTMRWAALGDAVDKEGHLGLRVLQEANG